MPGGAAPPSHAEAVGERTAVATGLAAAAADVAAATTRLAAALRTARCLSKEALNVYATTTDTRQSPGERDAKTRSESLGRVAEEQMQDVLGEATPMPSYSPFSALL